MRQSSLQGRRSFVWKAGAALSATAASVFAGAPERTRSDAGEMKARLARLEDLNAVRQLHDAYARHLNECAYHDILDLFADDARVEFAGGVFVGKDRGVRRLFVEHFGRVKEVLPEPVHTFLQRETHEHDAIEIAAGRLTATARFHVTVHAEAAIAPGCPLVDMALQQGGGVIKWVETGIFENVYAREGATWKIRQLAYRAETPRSTPFTSTYPEHPGGPDRLLTDLSGLRRPPAGLHLARREEVV